MDVCDNLTYTAHDLDDGITSGCTTPEEMSRGAALRRDWEGVVAEGVPTCPAGTSGLDGGQARARRRATDLLDASSRRISEAGVKLARGGAGAPAPADRLLGAIRSPAARGGAAAPRAFLSTSAARAGGWRSGRRLPDRLFDPTRTSPRCSIALEGLGDEVGAPRAVCDWIAGMTDREAADAVRKARLPFARALTVRCQVIFRQEPPLPDVT